MCDLVPPHLIPLKSQGRYGWLYGGNPMGCWNSKIEMGDSYDFQLPGAPDVRLFS